MGIFIFLGPTLAVEEARAILDATYLPPVSQGDVFRLVATHDVRVIGIIDGHFQDVPSVWHKELLWAMSQGVHVLGAASMGALRAAELADFGMVGEGRIFEAYCSGKLEPYDALFEDDDEVAVVHAPAELGYMPLSEAMVDIRCTLDLAARDQVISPALRDRLVALGKASFYAERTYDALLDRAGQDGWSRSDLARLRAWLSGGRFSQKQADARALLAKVKTGDFAEPKPARFEFHHTSVWDRLTAEALAGSVAAGAGLSTEEDAALAEVRLRPDEYLDVKNSAETALKIGPCPAVWRVARAMLNVLRREGSYDELAARAGRKRLLLSSVQLPQAADLAGLQSLQLLDWYFGRRLGRHIPDNVEVFAQSLGYHDRKDFIQALLREYAFVNSEAGLEAS
jgi:hypothetical protein